MTHFRNHQTNTTLFSQSSNDKLDFFQIELCQPDALHIMDGSLDEDRKIKSQLVKSGVLIPLPKYNNCFLARTDPKVILVSVFFFFFYNELPFKPFGGSGINITSQLK